MAARKHRLVDGGDLMRQRIDVRCVDRHHRIEEEREVDAFGFACQLKRRAIAIKRPRTLDGGDGEVRFIGSAQETLFGGAVRRAVEDLHRTVTNRHDGSNGRDCSRLESDKR